MEMDFTLCGGFSPRLERGERKEKERKMEREREEERARKRKKGGRKISKGRTPENIHIICHYVYTRIQEGAYKVLPTNFPCSVKIL